MADLDNVVLAIESAAKAAGLICDPARVQISFVVEKSVETPGIFGNPQCSLGISLASANEVAEDGVAAFAAGLIDSIKKHFPET